MDRLRNDQGRRALAGASWPSLRMDLIDAGADWVDDEVIVGRLVASRRPADLPAFCARMLDQIVEAGPFAPAGH